MKGSERATLHHEADTYEVAIFSYAFTKVAYSANGDAQHKLSRYIAVAHVKASPTFGNVDNLAVEDGIIESEDLRI